jgi:hypothetical protein
MRYGCSLSNDYNGIPQVVIRDFESTPKGRVLAIIPRESQHEAEQIAQQICDLLNKELE